MTLKVLRVEANAQKMALTTKDDATEREGGFRRGGPGRGRGDGPGRGRGGGGGRQRSSVAWSDPGDSAKGGDDQGVGSLGALLMAALDKPDKK